jgi:hypothetical protein
LKFALTTARADADNLVREHIDWALAQEPGWGGVVRAEVGA